MKSNFNITTLHPHRACVNSTRLDRVRKNIGLAFLENSYAKEFTVGNKGRQPVLHGKDLSLLFSSDLKLRVILDEMLAHVYAAAALVTGVEHLKGSYKGHPGSWIRVANTFLNRYGRVQIIDLWIRGSDCVQPLIVLPVGINYQTF